MRTEQFTYELPQELIAQHPCRERDQARMMVVHRGEQRIEHRCVGDLPDYVRAGDLLVVNDTRVIPARLMGKKEGTGGQVELLLIEEVEPNVWDALMRCSRRPRTGSRLVFGEGRLTAVLVEDGERGRARVRFESEQSVLEQLEEIGMPPLPPYIARKQLIEGQAAEDRDRYQTVYAREPGAVAAPTAGLHFTPDLLLRLEQMGIQRAAVTLHVGLGTFRPVAVEEVERHEMESECYRIPEETARLYDETRVAGGRVVAVGSTSVRTLETVMQERGKLVACEGRSSLFIYPPFEFKAVDVFMTNFHLPKSTLLMMVSAFGGHDLVLAAYEEAVREQYRFYSYGDCMLILQD